MALNIACRRAAVRSLQLRSFSTVVDDTFGRITPGSAPPPPIATSALENAVNAKAARFDWTKDEIREIYNTPLMELAFQAVSRLERRQSFTDT